MFCYVLIENSMGFFFNIVESTTLRHILVVKQSRRRLNKSLWSVHVHSTVYNHVRYVIFSHLRVFSTQQVLQLDNLVVDAEAVPLLDRIVRRSLLNLDRPHVRAPRRSQPTDRHLVTKPSLVAETEVIAGGGRVLLLWRGTADRREEGLDGGVVGLRRR